MSGKLPIEQHGGAVHLRLRVQPRASRNTLIQEAERIRVRLSSPPVDGKANAALCTYLGEVFAIPARRVQIVSGERSREKTVSLSGLTLSDVTKALMQLQQMEGRST